MTDTTYGHLDTEIEDTTAPEPQGSSLLDAMVADIEGDLDETRIWPLEKHPNWRGEFSIYISGEDMERLREGARKPVSNREARRAGARGDVDLFSLYLSIIQNQSAALWFKTGNGRPEDDGFEVVSASDGTPLTFNHPEFLSFVQRTSWGKQVASQREAVEAFIGAGYVSGLGDSITAAAGFGSKPEPLDP